MATKKVDIMEIKQLLRLKEKGESNRSCERKLGIHRNTINHYVRLFLSSGLSYQALLLLDDKTLQAMFPEREKIDTARYKILSGYFSILFLIFLYYLAEYYLSIFSINPFNPFNLFSGLSRLGKSSLSIIIM